MSVWLFRQSKGLKYPETSNYTPISLIFLNFEDLKFKDRDTAIVMWANSVFHLKILYGSCILYDSHDYIPKEHTR